MKALIFFLLISGAGCAQSQTETFVKDSLYILVDSLGNHIPSGNQGDGGSPEDAVEFRYNSSRKIIQPPVFYGKSEEEGRIALDIWVDENGTVVKAVFLESKSTSQSEYLIQNAIRAALTIKYESKPGAGIEKMAYQVFDFKILP